MAKIPGDKKHIANITKYKDFSPELDIEVADSTVAGNYVVYSKDIPDETPHPGGGTIKWFNAFGVKDKDGNDADVEYTVTLQKLPADTKLYWLAKNKKDFHEITSFENVDDKHVRFRLAVGDPPTGVYP